MNDHQFSVHIKMLTEIASTQKAMLGKLEEIRCGIIDMENALKPVETNTTIEEAEECEKGKMVSIERILESIEYNTNLLRR